jgi:hypothetical protein
MPTLNEARTALAAAVTSGGLECLAYPPDNPSPPIAFVDDLGMDFSGQLGGGTTFCMPGTAVATIVTIAQRNDRAGSMQFLEGLIPGVLQALQDTPGVRVATANSGQTTVGGVEVPAVVYSVQFFI